MKTKPHILRNANGEKEEQILPIRYGRTHFRNATGIGDITISQLLIIALIVGAVWKHKAIIAFFKGK